MNLVQDLLSQFSRRRSSTSPRASTSRTSRGTGAAPGKSDGGSGGEDDEKARQLKERNRMAAHRSREKKKVRLRLEDNYQGY